MVAIRRCVILASGAVMFLQNAPVVLAHPGQPPAPHDLPTAWSWDPLLLLGLLLGGWGYMRGVRTLWGRAGAGRGLSYGRVAAFAVGLVVLFGALVSPLDALGAALLSAHMVQHMLLVLVAAPLLVLGMPQIGLLWALPEDDRRGLGRWWRRSLVRRLWRCLSRPALAWLLHAGALWLWHLPAAYQAALLDEAVHGLEHASFLGTGLLFWSVVLAGGSRAPLAPGTAVLYLFAFMLQSGLLGALLTFAGDPWYPAYAASTAAWGLTPLADQQLAGLIMWIPSGLVYLAAALLPLARLFGVEEDAAQWAAEQRIANVPAGWSGREVER